MSKPRLVLKVFLILILLAATASSPARADDTYLLRLEAPAATLSSAQWETFGDNLVRALASGHEGLQNGAMRLAIQYSDNVDVSAGVLDLMRIYRNADEISARRLAAVALGSTGSPLALNYLRLHVDYEKSEIVKRTILAVLANA